MGREYNIIAVDFDGTLCEDKWPDIGEPNTELISYLKKCQKAGDRIILWTCRVGRHLEDAIEWAKEQGLVFNAVNANLQECIDRFGNDCRKVHADKYLDDKNCCILWNADRKELIGRLIDTVEDWLTEKAEKLGAEQSVLEQPFITGEDYDSLANKFATALGIPKE